MAESKALHCLSVADMSETRCGEFVDFVAKRTGLDFGELGGPAYQKLHQWSVDELETFHDLAWDFMGMQGDKGSRVLAQPDNMLESRFFPEGSISYTENMLNRAKTHPQDPAIISRVVGRDSDRVLSWQALCDDVSRWVQVLQKLGVAEGDRVSTYLTHIPEAYVILLACAELGAIFSSVGTEMGAQATANRFRQIEPKVLIAVDGYTHMARPGQPGKREERLPIVAELQQQIPNLEATVIIPNLEENPDLHELSGKHYLAPELLQQCQPAPLAFTRREFNYPLMILFSSGSTGEPKCFVHGVGGTLLKHGIEHQLQCDTRPGDRFFFHSTTSWMMFNWLAGGLAQGVTLLIYDGNPVYPAMDAQLQFAAEYGCTHFGIAAAIIQDVWMKNSVDTLSLDLSAMRQMMYTGSVLSEEGFNYVDRAIKPGMSINGICGGTDFVGCYAAGNPLAATYAGQLKGPVLGMAVEVWDDQGNALAEDQVGELVVSRPFASRPLYFWKDEGGKRYQSEYFEHFAGLGCTVWRHGDAVKWMNDGQLVIEGRSDTTLNQGGVRLGTQQIYDAMAHPQLQSLVVDSLAASFQDSIGSEHTILFLQMAEGTELDDALGKQIKAIISDSVGRLCTPHKLIAVPYLLKTPNGKKAEKPTAQLLKGKVLDSPETYGMDGGQYKADLYIEWAEKLKAEFG
ncbi:MAG: acetoacetate--CoA ligase [Candidatus Pelagadaptatus aseana]|uniref:acetoacetate--CoA ligase n=1 Tax=Candidatus Pelagadaptatus aseana TaxID=3120508 RepID=UPI0039B155DF